MAGSYFPFPPTTWATMGRPCMPPKGQAHVPARLPCPHKAENGVFIPPPPRSSVLAGEGRGLWRAVYFANLENISERKSGQQYSQKGLISFSVALRIHAPQA